MGGSEQTSERGAELGGRERGVEVGEIGLPRRSVCLFVVVRALAGDLEVGERCSQQVAGAIGRALGVVD